MELSFKAYGDESGPPLIALHGLLGSSRNWQTAAQALARTFRVYCLDLRNHGESPWAKPHDYESMVADVIRFMDTRLRERAVVLGHSMGGKVAMKLACEHAHRLRKLIVVDISPKAYPRTHESEFRAMREANLREAPSRGAVEFDLERHISDWGMRKFLLTNLARSEEAPGFRWVVNLDAIEANLPELEASSLAHNQRYEGDTLFVVGGKSRYFSSADIPLIRRHFPASAIEVIAESGHNPHFETRERFVEIVSDFVAGEGS